MTPTKKIVIEFDDAEAAAFAMLRAACERADPAANWTDELLAHSMLLTILEDDLASHHRPAVLN